MVSSFICQCGRSGYVPSILRHNGISLSADEADEESNKKGKKIKLLSTESAVL